MLCVELRTYTKEWIWYVRFALIYSLVAQTTMFSYILNLWNYFDKTVLNIVISHFAVQALFSVFYLVYFPSLEQVEYTPVTVADITWAPADYEPLPGGENICPEFQVNIITRLLFSWMTPLMEVGYKRPIGDQDIWQLAESDKTEPLYTNFQRYC